MNGIYGIIILTAAILITGMVDKPEYYSMGSNDVRVAKFHVEGGRPHSGLRCASCHMSGDTRGERR